MKISIILRLLKRQFVYWLPVYVYMGLIFYFSSQSVISIGSGQIGGFFISNYIKHSVEYLILGLLVFRGFSHSKFKKNSSLFTFILAGLYGFSDEIHQLFVIGRQFSLLDVGADLIGIVIAVLIYKKIIQKF